MSRAIENLQAAMQRAIAGRPPIGSFPFLAETLRRAGVRRNVWSLPGCESLYLTGDGPVAMPGTPLISGMVDVPHFDQAALVRALRADQAGRSTFPEFLAAAWAAGIIRYEVDFEARTVRYFGVADEVYEEAYPAVEVS